MRFKSNHDKPFHAVGDLLERLKAENDQLRKALEEIEQLSLGPDRGSAAWQACQAHEIAKKALGRPC